MFIKKGGEKMSVLQEKMQESDVYGDYAITPIPMNKRRSF